jgi:hypothetical protein
LSYRITYFQPRGLPFCHVERSRDISYYLNLKARDSSTALGTTEKQYCAHRGGHPER